MLQRSRLPVTRERERERVCNNMMNYKRLVRQCGQACLRGLASFPVVYGEGGQAAPHIQFNSQVVRLPTHARAHALFCPWSLVVEGPLP